MTRIIDISNKDGKLWAEDEGYLSDFVEDIEYLFSIEIFTNSEKCRIFKKPGFEFANNIFSGTYYITIPNYCDGELHCTNDEKCYQEWNILESYEGEYISDDYMETLTLNLDDMTAISKVDDSLDDVVKENRWSRDADREHSNSEKTY